MGFKKLPLSFNLYILLTIATGLAMAANTIFRLNFFDAVKVSAQTGHIAQAILTGIAMALFLVFTLILRALQNLQERNFFLSLQGHMGIKLNQKAARVDPIAYEDHRFLDHINKAFQGLEASAQIVSGFMSILLVNTFYFLFMGSFLYSVHPMLLIMLLVSFVPSILGAFLRYRLFSRSEDLVAPYRRKTDYYGKCVYDRELAKETRMLGGYGYFYELFSDSLKMVTKLNWKATSKSEMIEVMLRFLMLGGYAGTLIMLFNFLMNGQIRIAIFAAVLSSIDLLFDQMEDAFNFKLGSIVRFLGQSQNYLMFLQLPERVAEASNPLDAKSVVLKNVSFSYPGATKPAISGIDLEIKEGETIAIVGENGAGKSTLARLIMGLYLPSEGQVFIDCQDTKKISIYKLYENISAVFQRFQRYKMTLKENIVISGSDSSRAIEEALGKADITASSRSFPMGEDTILGKDFGGVDLSGGQWQRIAIARGFYRKHNLIVLDEPTASIDPFEESIIYHKFAEISRGKTSVIITHRLGSARIADRIVVMDGGRILDMGSHDELLGRGGKYSEMYNTQARWYK